jgi:hypothetical protein
MDPQSFPGDSLVLMCVESQKAGLGKGLGVIMEGISRMQFPEFVPVFGKKRGRPISRHKGSCLCATNLTGAGHGRGVPEKETIGTFESVI